MEIIRLNVERYSDRQLFYISEYYYISFEFLIELKEYKNMDVLLNVSHIYANCDVPSYNPFIGYVDKDIDDKNNIIINKHYAGFTKKQYDALKKLKPISIPKCTEFDLEHYSKYLEKGYDIRIEGLDKMLEQSSDQINISPKRDIIQISNELEDAVLNEDYLLAAKLKKEIDNLK